MAKRKLEPEEWVTLIANSVKALRKSKGYTSYETFALDNGIDRKQYWRIEKGLNVTVKTLIRVLEIHELDLVQFFTLIEQTYTTGELLTPKKRKKPRG